MPNQEFPDVQRILNAARKSAPSAMVELWEAVRPDANAKLFQDAQQASLSGTRTHNAFKKTIVAWLRKLRDEDPPHPTPPPIEGKYALAVLEALDDYLLYRYQHYQATAHPVKLGGVRYFVHRRHELAIPKYAGQPNHLQPWLRHHWVVARAQGDLCIEPFAAPDHMEQALAAAYRRGSLRVYVAGFTDGIEPAWENATGNLNCCSRLTDPDGRWRRVEIALERAVEMRADVFVLPELTVCPDVFARVVEWLQEPADPVQRYIPLILPGTFHRVLDGKNRNEARLLDDAGETILTHYKLNPIGWLDADNTPKFVERLETGSEVRVLMTPLGLLAIPICLDFCQEEQPFSTLWSNLGIQCALVPAMGTRASLSAHADRAKVLSRGFATLAVVAHQALSEEGVDREQWRGCFGFVRGPLAGEPEKLMEADAAVPGGLVGRLVEISLDSGLN